MTSSIVAICGEALRDGSRQHRILGLVSAPMEQVADSTKAFGQAAAQHVRGVIGVKLKPSHAGANSSLY